MQRSTARLFVTLLFLALLASPIIYKRVIARRQAANTSRNEAAAFARYGFRFEESAKASGVNFKHTAPTLDPKLNHIMLQVASMGASVSVVDFDRDGWDDFYVTSSSEHGPCACLLYTSRCV